MPAIDEQGYRRKQANTFFTFPEWYIVYSFEDFGRFLDRSSESQFGYVSPYPRILAQLLHHQPRGAGERRIPLTDVKTMIYVIGVSYSVEYAIKGFYENTIGRVTEWIRGSARTPQDDYARKVLQDYAAFLYTIPWFKFPFGEKLDGLMAISAPTPSPLRSWERNFALGAEYFVKIGYAAADPEGARRRQRQRAARYHVGGGDAAAGRAGEGAAHQAGPHAHAAMAAGADAALQGFDRDLKGLLDQGIPLAEIAGNHEILITVIAPKAAKLGRERTPRNCFRSTLTPNPASAGPV